MKKRIRDSKGIKFNERPANYDPLKDGPSPDNKVITHKQLLKCLRQKKRLGLDPWVSDRYKQYEIDFDDNMDIVITKQVNLETFVITREMIEKKAGFKILI